MTPTQTPQQVREEVKLHHTGRWYIAELDNPQLAVQGESAADARQKIVKRWKEYTDEPDKSDIRITDSTDSPEDVQLLSRSLEY